MPGYMITALPMQLLLTCYGQLVSPLWCVLLSTMLNYLRFLTKNEALLLSVEQATELSGSTALLNRRSEIDAAKALHALKLKKAEFVQGLSALSFDVVSL